MEMWSSLVLMQIATKYPKCWITFLEIFYIHIQYLYSQISFFCSNSHILTITNLEYYFMEQLLLFTLSDLFIIVCDLPILSFSDIVSLHSIVKQFLINFFQILIFITNVQLYSVRIYIFCYKIPSVMSQ